MCARYSDVGGPRVAINTYAAKWSGWRVLRSRPQVPRTCALLLSYIPNVESGQGIAPCSCGLQPQPFACSVAGLKVMVERLRSARSISWSQARRIAIFLALDGGRDRTRIG